jgi:hypothetical protein
MIPDQRPQRRKVALRPRRDSFRLPRFPEPRERPLRPEPFDGGDWTQYRADPEPLDLSLGRHAIVIGACIAFIGWVWVMAETLA